MGNFNSSWLHRNQHNHVNDLNTHITTLSSEEVENSLQGGSSLVVVEEEEQSAPSRRYDLRQTVHRTRRNLNRQTENSTLHNNLSTTSVTSTASSNSRRRRREPDAHDDLEDGRSESETRRRRVEENNEIPLDDTNGRSMLFYFNLPYNSSQDEGDSLNITSPEPGTASRSDSPRRRSSRLQQAADFIRNRFRSHHQQPVSSITSDSSTNDGMGAQVVFLRIRQLSRPATDPSTVMNPPNTTDADPNSEDARAVFQWTIYLLMPRHQDSNGTNPLITPEFDTNAAVQRAMATMQAIISGDNMSFEDWIRLQEMMGAVNRGVTKDQIDATMASKAYTSALGIGPSCTICLSDFVEEESIRSLPCLHSYHSECIDTWLTSCNKCPMCRQPPVAV